jgi:tRNA A37 threonylcarbamoyladenosine modification protein TsaB
VVGTKLRQHKRLAGELLPKARFIATLAEIAYRGGLAVAAEQAQPIYLRDKVAQKFLNVRK